mmetsp:Transcript_7205/g.10533  ORF Transcript_7205/g.10533 Transcript_7205/m.10533 type:complete len:308 (+) Transcript_7205:48-971(+)
MSHRRKTVGIAEESRSSAQKQEESIDWTAAFDSIGPNLKKDDDNQQIDFASLNPLPIRTKDIDDDQKYATRKKNPSDPGYHRKKRFNPALKPPIDGYNVYFHQLQKELLQQSGAKELPSFNSNAFTNFVDNKWICLTKIERGAFEAQAIQGRRRYSRQEIKQRPTERLIGGKGDMTSHQGLSTNFDHSRAYGHYHTASNPSIIQPNENALPMMLESGTPQLSGSFAASQHYQSHPSTSGMNRYLPQVRVPLAEGEGKRPLPPGSEVCLRDHQTGRIRSYTVQYSMVTMSRKEATDYLMKLNKDRNTY